MTGLFVDQWTRDFRTSRNVVDAGAGSLQPEFMILFGGSVARNGPRHLHSIIVEF